MACGEILAKLRKERRYTQQKVAAILHVSKSTISNYEKSVYHPPYDILVNFSEMYGVSVDYLLGRTDCRIEIDRLDQKLAYGYTLKNCIDCIMEADKEKTAHLLKYFELTQPDFRKKKRKRGAEKSKAERNKIEKSKEERNKVEQSKAERNKVEESKAERHKIETSKEA
ncbi:MAG: helix-turn-helix domain-containing protein [Clostridium sp.]|jgi:transcriptional regulator with XRE-family HTH domain|nr:helix-turn-helix domain-containing protein [Clostridium sp.]